MRPTIDDFYKQLYYQPKDCKELFEKAQVFCDFSVNLPLDYCFDWTDKDGYRCSEMFCQILMLDLLARTSLAPNDRVDADYMVIRNCLLKWLRSKKTGRIWRYVVDDVNTRFLIYHNLNFDFRKCVVLKKYFSEFEEFNVDF